MNRRPFGARVACALAAVLPLVLGAAPALAQEDYGTVSITIDGGPGSGEHELPLLGPCVADAGPPATWTIDTLGDDASSFSVSWSGGDTDLLTVQAGVSFDDFYAVMGTLDGQVDDRGQEATLTVEADTTSMADASPVHLTAVVECRQVSRLGEWPDLPSIAPPTEQPMATIEPVVLGSPPAASTVFSMVLDTGEDAGSYSVWTLDDGCRRMGAGGWLASYVANGTQPTTVSVLVLEDASAVVGTVEVGFGFGEGYRSYRSLAPAVTVDDRGDSATISVSGPVEVVRDGAVAGASPRADASPAPSPLLATLESTIECGTVD